MTISSTPENHTNLEIEKMAEGGFVVMRPRIRGAEYYSTPFLFAATTIEECLKFIKGKLDPKK